MLTLVHGDDIAASRTFFVNAKKRALDPITLDVDTLTLTHVYQVLSGGGLFQEEKYLFIESLLTKKKKSPEFQALIDTLLKAEDTSIYLWENKEIDKKTVASLKGATSQLFTLPKSLFLFLDSLKPGNPSALKLFHKTREQVEVELIFFMIQRQMRYLLALSERQSDTIDEVKRMQPWQKTKLEKQARYFKPNTLKNHYLKLYEIDLAQKTGQLPRDLASSIDIWLLEL